MKALTKIAMTLAATCAAAPASAQHAPISVDVRGGFNLPAGEFADAGGVQANSDVGLGAGAVLALGSNLGVYGGVAWDRFGCDGCDDGTRISTFGLEGGLEANLPVRWAARPWVRGGLVWSQAEWEEEQFEIESDRSLGFQASAGLDLPLGNVLSVRPAVRYQRFEAEFGSIGDIVDVSRDVSFWSLDLGARIRFPR